MIEPEEGSQNSPMQIPTGTFLDQREDESEEEVKETAQKRRRTELRAERRSDSNGGVVTIQTVPAQVSRREHFLAQVEALSDPRLRLKFLKLEQE